MLELLRIQNFILIEKEEVNFSKGLTVVTGETGAGKSLLLQALSLILGGRAKPGLVRNGEKCWEIEALIDLTQLPNETRLELPEIIEEGTEQLILYRSQTDSGKSRILINGKLGSVKLLEQLGQQIIHICSQGAFISLLEPAKHVEILDNFATLNEDSTTYKNSYHSWNNLRKELKQAKERQEFAALRKAELEFVVEELEAAKITSGIRENLENEVKALSSIEERLQRASVIQSLIDDDRGALSVASDIKEELKHICRHDSSVSSDLELITSIIAEFEELSRSMARYGANTDVSEEVLEEKREQLAEIARLERKFHKSDQELVNLLDKSKEELAELMAYENLKNLEQELEKSYQQVMLQGESLAKKRKAAADLLAKAVSSELKELNMPGANLSVNFTRREPEEVGLDAIEIFIETNAGTGMKPLRQVASGGELSRILLVLKKILRDKSGVTVLVFDEVDSGVSGKVARAMGEKLKSLAEDTQVICISHLAQVASLADMHLVVTKSGKKLPRTRIIALDQNDRIEEIARMLAGYKVTDVSRASARELLAS